MKYKDNSDYYVVHDEMKLYEHDLYAFFFYDFSIGEELEKQMPELKDMRESAPEKYGKRNHKDGPGNP